jgi:tripartite-type tricarboxylate transporter receptor subunit TctC
VKTFRPFSQIALALGIAFAAASQAQTPADGNYPSHPVRIIVPIGPGSSGDTLTRSLADKFRNLTGQPAIVENRSGADLALGTQNMANSPADGYTIVLVSASSTIINPFVMKDMPYKVEDIMPVLGLTRNVAVLVASPASRFNTFGDLIEAGRKAPGSVSVGTYGNTYRLGAIDLGRRTGVQFNQIPYKGAANLLNDVVGGAVDVGVLDIAAVTPLVSSGKLRALAVAGEKRHPWLPMAPTVQESGYPGYTLYAFIGYAIHAKTPEPIASRIEALFQQIIADPALREQIAQQSGGEIMGTNRQQFSAMIADETKRTRELIKTAGVDLLH